MQPIFIIGAPRSGTTWLQLMLSQSPEIATCQETHLFSMYYKSLFDSLHEHDHTSSERFVGVANVIGHQDFLQIAQNHITDIFLRLKATSTNPNARFFVEKSPQHVMHLEPIRAVFPDAKFIEIVRDPRSVVASLRAVDWGNWTNPGTIVNARQWSRAITATQHYSIQCPDLDKVTIKYEDLRRDPETHLAQILEWIGDAENASFADEYVRACEINNLRTGQGVEAPWDLSSEPRTFYRKGTMDSWNTELTAAQIRLVEAVCSDGMQTHGYKRRFGPSLRSALMLRLYWLLRSVSWRCARIANAI